jgi:hypothetical protein
MANLTDYFSVGFINIEEREQQGKWLSVITIILRLLYICGFAEYAAGVDRGHTRPEVALVRYKVLPIIIIILLV